MILTRQHWGSTLVTDRIQKVPIHHVSYFFNSAPVQELTKHISLEEIEQIRFSQLLTQACFFAEKPSEVYYSLVNEADLTRLTAYDLTSFYLNDWVHLQSIFDN